LYKKGNDVMKKMIKNAVACFLVLILLLMTVPVTAESLSTFDELNPMPQISLDVAEAFLDSLLATINTMTPYELGFNSDAEPVVIKMTLEEQSVARKRTIENLAEILNEMQWTQGIYLTETIHCCGVHFEKCIDHCCEVYLYACTIEAFSSRCFNVGFCVGPFLVTRTHTGTTWARGGPVFVNGVHSGYVIMCVGHTYRVSTRCAACGLGEIVTESSSGCGTVIIDWF